MSKFNAVRIASVLAALAIAPLSGCLRKAPEEAPPSATYASSSLQQASGQIEATPPVLFSDASGAAASGVDFKHENGAFGEKWMPETMNGGVCFLDFTGDGLPDLFFVNGDWWQGHEKEGERPTSEFYVNLGGGKFRKATDEYGLAVHFYGFGCAAGDYDNDGDVELFVSGIGDNRLFRNDGIFFTNVSGESKVNAYEREAGSNGEWDWTGAALWADVDRDGRLDLFFCNYVRWSPEKDIFTTLDGVNKTYATPQQYEGASCRLMGNRGDGTFEERTRAAGLYNPKGKGLGAVLADVNDDGWVDLIVANDTQPDCLYINNGDGSFQEAGEEAGIAYDRMGRAKAGMGVDVAFLEGNAESAIAVGNFTGENISLFQSRGKGTTFVDQAPRRGIAAPSLKSLTFGLQFIDMDLDGRQDLIAANGHIEPTIQDVQKDVRFAQPMNVFRNLGEKGFVDESKEAGEAMAKPYVARGLAAADMDFDGDLDLAVSINEGNALLLRNDGRNGNAIQARLLLRRPSGFAYGARAVATANGAVQRFIVKSSSSYMSQSDPTLVVGIGKAEKVDRLEIFWPDGTSEKFENLAAGRRYDVLQGEGIVAEKTFSDL